MASMALMALVLVAARQGPMASMALIPFATVLNGFCLGGNGFNGFLAVLNGFCPETIQNLPEAIEAINGRRESIQNPSKSH